MSGQIVLIGNKVKAKYKEQQIGMYKHNPYIEALPPVLDIIDVAKRISRRPLYNQEERKIPSLQRIHSVQTISNFIEPCQCILIWKPIFKNDSKWLYGKKSY